VITATIAALREHVPGHGPDDGLSDADITGVLQTYLMQVLAALRGQSGPSLAATDEVMERRAESGISLPQMLHSYRVGILTLWSGLAARAQESPQAADALISAAPTIFEMLDRFSLRANEIHTRLRSGPRAVMSRSASPGSTRYSGPNRREARPSGRRSPISASPARARFS
jgi:hypothetical protein